jgi:hypothetical protein
MGVDVEKLGDYYTNAISWTADALNAALDGQAQAEGVRKAS